MRRRQHWRRTAVVDAVQLQCEIRELRESNAKSEAELQELRLKKLQTAEYEEVVIELRDENAMLERDLLALQAWKAESDRAEMVARADVEETMREMRGRMTAMALSQQQILRDENKALSIANQALRQLLQSTDCPNKTRPKEPSETMPLFISWPTKNAFGHSLSPAEVIEHIKIYGTIESWTQTDTAKAGKTELLVRMSSFLEVKRLVAANLRLRCTELQISGKFR